MIPLKKCETTWVKKVIVGRVILAQLITVYLLVKIIVLGSVQFSNKWRGSWAFATYTLYAYWMFDDGKLKLQFSSDLHPKQYLSNTSSTIVRNDGCMSWSNLI